MVNKNRNNNLEDLLESSKVPHEHIFNNHDRLSEYWCFNTRSSVGKNYNDKYDRFHCKENNN